MLPKVSDQIGFNALEVTKKSGEEIIHSNSLPLGPSLLDFWRWSASDLVSNATRGIFAEFLVATALGLAEGIRAEWDPFDLLTPDGVKIEVKSAAYLQSWYHAKLSNIIFGIRPTRRWDAATNTSDEELRRQADIYIFCVLNHKDKTTIDPLNVCQWKFYLIRSSELDIHLPAQKTISLVKLLSLKPLVAEYHDISRCVSVLSHP
jgi:hypothetical protein